ncbi:uncharacterized protein CEXT_184771 [Caerostris extrusa]|uniref:Uncharacterized protein n=1 Tax=Caerostris extrusa TaxID=172846 RepID=A0AAV4U311_CAEEX|nr:uncharacterized protein CEXT_184771 [Caerostris extrusa]
MIQRQGELMEKAKERNPAALVDGWAQTEFVTTKRRQKEGHGKFVDENTTENDTSKPIITVIKKALAEFLKEVRKHLSIQREGGIADMRIIFSQISEDREDIKSAIERILGSFLQTQKNFEQFGLVGREAIKCLAKLNEKSESGMAVRFLEFGDKLRGIFELLKGLNFDVSSIKQTLDNIDGQFDEIYQKLELGCQKNADHSEEISTRLQQTAEEWKQKSSNLEQISKHIGATTDGMKEMLCNLNNLICCKTMDASEMNIQQYAPGKRKASFSTYEKKAMLTDKNLAILNQYTSLEGLGALSAMIQICLSKLNSLKIR